MMNHFVDMRESRELSGISQKTEISQQANERFEMLMNENTADTAQQEQFVQQLKDFFESNEEPHNEIFTEKPEAEQKAILSNEYSEIPKDAGEKTEYIVNGNVYHTDECGRIVSCDAQPKLCEDGKRNIAEQLQSGGEYRREGDQGGHIVARVLGGSEGEENLVPMRGKINQGDYKKMELEIKDALKENKNIKMHVELQYEGESSRPTKFEVKYSIDGKNTEIIFDNEPESTDLMQRLKGKISDKDYNDLTEEVEDMRQDGCPAAITSVKTVLDTDGNAEKVVVGFLDESSGSKSYKTFTAQE